MTNFPPPWPWSCFARGMNATRMTPLNPTLNNLPDPDLRRVASAVAGIQGARRAAILSLLRDPKELPGMLDQPAIARAARQLKGRVSDPLYCYVEVRQRLLSAGIRNRETALYLSGTWCEYRETGLLPETTEKAVDLLETVDILRELNFVEGYEKFELLVRCGNYYLFLMAFFEGWFRELERLKGRPALAYYEAFARIAYRAARDHGLCEEFGLRSVFNDLSSRFTEVRGALASLAG